MTAPAKLAAFGVILAAVFGVAFLTGTQSAALLAPPAVHSNELGGLSASVDGYTLTAVDPVVDPGEDVFVEFSITGPDGRTAPELDDVDGSHVHVFAVRRDLTGFQHVTPDPGPGTSWWPVLNLTPGPWQVIVELQPLALGREITLATGFDVSGDYRAESLPAAADEVVINGLTVRWSGALTTGPGSRSTFTVSDRESSMTGSVRELLAMQIKRRVGSSETVVKEFTVMARKEPSRPVVTTSTPVANMPEVRRNNIGSTVMAGLR